MSANEVEVKAKEIGWVPKEAFRGDPEKWVDAEEFIRRGEELMPLIKATNKKQAEEIKELRGTLTETQKKLADATDAIAALTETTSKAAIKAVKEEHEKLKGALKEAKESGDVDAEEEIREKLTETRDAIKAAEAAPPVKPTKAEPPPGTDQETPEFRAWKEDNNWFGVDKRRTALALGIAQELREKGEKAVGRDFYDKVTEEVNAFFGDGQAREAPSKVEGDARGAGERGTKGDKSYASLPAEAKQACERAAGRLVGDGKQFKTLDAWRKHYTAKYYEEA